MNLLQFFFIISGVIILILAIDIAKKQRFNTLHFLVFIGVGGGLLYFSFFPGILNSIGLVFGLARGADVLVYTSIIFLLYFVLLLLRKIEENKDDFTKLIRELAINNSKKQEIFGKEVFIIPAYNESTVILETINNILGKGYKNILIINDGSSDNTTSLIEKKLANKVIILNHLKNRGQGASLETGFEYIRRYAKVDYIITFDADGQHNVDDVKKFEKILDNEKKVDILLGSRFLTKTNNKIPLFRIIILKLGILFTFFISNINLSDTHNGFRVFRKKILKDINITIDGMGHASEIIDIISDKKLSYKEVPSNIIYTEYSKNKGQSSGNAIKIALRVIWNKFIK